MLQSTRWSEASGTGRQTARAASSGNTSPGRNGRKNAPGAVLRRVPGEGPRRAGRWRMTPRIREGIRSLRGARQRRSWLPPGPFRNHLEWTLPRAEPPAKHGRGSARACSRPRVISDGIRSVSSISEPSVSGALVKKKTPRELRSWVNPTPSREVPGWRNESGRRYGNRCPTRRSIPTGGVVIFA